MVKSISYILPLFICFLSCKTSTSQDWANLERYQQANKELQNTTMTNDRVVLMGNSITEGWSLQRPEFFEGKAFVNRGIGGQTTPQMLLRFRQDVIDLNPKIVVILAGTNDIAGNTGPVTLEQIKNNILSMVELAQSNAILPIVASVLPAFDYPWKSGVQPNIKIPKLNAILIKMAQEKGIMYLDYFSSMADENNGLPKSLATDGVHPTKEGYKIMETLLENAIEEALQK